MSEVPVQSSAFPEIVPEAPLRPATGAEAVPVPRPPGWVLVATRSGPVGFHRVKTVGVEGSVVTLCGITGRVINDHERMIVLCAACEAVPPT